MRSDKLKNRIRIAGISGLFIAIFISLPLNGQLSFHNDTIKISEVVIRKKTIDTDLPGYKKCTFDTTSLNNYSTKTLADLLSENTGVFIKSYGMGGIATPSFRGTGANHTVIDWNGISINNPMLGQSDLSLIPVGLIDDIRILYGGASMSLNSGGIGGTINLETKPEWKKQTSISSSTGIGSFGNYSEFLKIKTGNFNVQTVTKGFYANAENNFRYLNDEAGTEPVWQTRTHSQVHQHGFMQEIYLHGSQSVASARIWYQSSERNLPGTLLTQQTNTGEKQFDESLRTMLNYNLFKNNSNLSFTGAWMLSRSNYFNKQASIDSRNLAEGLTLKAVFENQMAEYIKLQIILEDQLNDINSNNYTQKITRNSSTLTASVSRNKNRLGTTILISEIIDRNIFLVPDFSAAVQFRLSAVKDYFLKASFSRNSKLPGMNDLYWEPGGNRDLKNEYALMSELSYEMDQKITEKLNFTYNMSVFRYNIRDMIQWHKGEYSYWVADNIKSVRSTGMEASISINYKYNNFSSRINAGYTLTKSVTGVSDTGNDESAGKQLMYVPEHQDNGSLLLGFRNLYIILTANFIGKRYITEDNSKYLREYLLNNITAGIKFPFKNFSVDINLNIDNLLNVNYQSIANYPLPGRSYLMKMLINLYK